MDPFHGGGQETERRRVTGEVHFELSDEAPSPFARDLVCQMLRPHAKNRPSAAEALKHQWMVLSDDALSDVRLDFAYEGINYY